MSIAENGADGGADFAGVAILDRSQDLAVAVARLLAPSAVTVDGGATASVAALSECAVHWAVNDTNGAKVLILRAELSDGTDRGGPHQMHGIDVAQKVHDAVPGLAVLLFGVMEAEQARRRARGSPFPYIDLVAQGTTLRFQVRALLDTTRNERPSVTRSPNTLSGLAAALTSLRCAIAPSLTQEDDGSAINDATAAAFMSVEWADIHATCGALVIPDNLHPGAAAQLRDLRSRLVGLGAMARGVTQARNESDRRRLVTEYLARIDTARLLVEQHARR